MTSMDDYEYINMIGAGKRLGVKWAPWMGDRFVSWSPRNYNDHAEGQWDQWVSMAIKILQHPYTQITRPDAAEAVRLLDPKDYYTEADVVLTEEQIREHLTEAY